ncbi:hypothetical protein H9P43_003404 [Blastocladiella emersonii ATCC 22665]|nr:hypothetical protein H9P43_003404 [Blastocladiella emersonii ATCC 22665]
MSTHASGFMPVATHDDTGSPAPPPQQELFTPLTQDELAILAPPSGGAARPPVAAAPLPPASTAIQMPPAASPSPAPAAAAAPASFVSGAMGSLLPAEGEIRTFAAGDTLDEPVRVTILRDLTAIWVKLRRVCFPRGGKSDVLRDWDLWGPLLLCLALSISMSISAPKEQTAAVFTGIFVIVWAGAAVVTLNTKLLGGNLSFFQSVCVLGYCIFPLFLASLVALFVGWIVIRAPIVAGAFLWSTYASLAFLNAVNLAGRRLLAVYPVYIFYFTLAWMILISKALV